MKDNKDILKAFIHSMITLVLLYVLLDTNIIFEETYVKLGFIVFLLPLVLIVEALIPESYD